MFDYQNQQGSHSLSKVESSVTLKPSVGLANNESSHESKQKLSSTNNESSCALKPSVSSTNNESLDALTPPTSLPTESKVSLIVSKSPTLPKANDSSTPDDIKSSSLSMDCLLDSGCASISASAADAEMVSPQTAVPVPGAVTDTKTYLSPVTELLNMCRANIKPFSTETDVKSSPEHPINMSTSEGLNNEINCNVIKIENGLDYCASGSSSPIHPPLNSSKCLTSANTVASLPKEEFAMESLENSNERSQDPKNIIDAEPRDKRLCLREEITSHAVPLTSDLGKLENDVDKATDISKYVPDDIPVKNIDNIIVETVTSDDLKTIPENILVPAKACKVTSESAVEDEMQTLPVKDETAEEREVREATEIRQAVERERLNKAVVEQRLKSFVHLKENLYLVERKKSKQSKEVRRMVCDCALTKEELLRGEKGCGEDCLNRLLMIEWLVTRQSLTR